MMRRIMHCVATAVACAIIALLLALAMPRKADAIPVAWRATPRFTQNGITYRVKGWDAVVVKTSRRNVTIPAEVRYKDRWYEVRAIWDGALKGVRRVTIHADLETCEDARLWKIPVRVSRYGVFKWLKRTKADVTKFKCPHCK